MSTGGAYTQTHCVSDCSNHAMPSHELIILIAKVQIKQRVDKTIK